MARALGLHFETPHCSIRSITSSLATVMTIRITWGVPSALLHYNHWSDIQAPIFFNVPQVTHMWSITKPIAYK